MPITVERDDERRRMIARATGLVFPPELLEFIRQERAGMYGQYALLFDATEASTRARPADVQLVLEEVLSGVARAGPRGPVAIVATRGVGALAKMYEAACHGAGLHVIRVFPDRVEAEKWLGWARGGPDVVP